MYREKIEDCLFKNSDAIIMSSDDEIPSNGVQNEVKIEANVVPETNSTEDERTIVKSTFEPSTVVLAKVKGYPPWPAMVLAENLLPEHILSKKPKGGPVKVPKKGKGSKSAVLGNGIPVSVRFFSDDTYIWTKESDLKPLTQIQIEQFLGKEDKRKAKLLKQAYELARDPPPIEEFIEYGSIGKAAFEEIQQKEDDKIAKAEAKARAKTEAAEAKAELKRKLEEEKKQSRKKQKTGLTKREQAKERATQKAAEDAKKKEELEKAKEEALARKREAKKKEAEKTTGYDSDWGIDIEYDHEAGDYIFEDPEEQEEFEENFAHALEIAQESAEKTLLLKEIKANLQELLFPSDSEDIGGILSEETKPRQFTLAEVAKINQEIKELINAKIPTLIVKSTEVLKLLVVALRQPKERLDNDKVRKAISKYLKTTFDLTVRPNELGEMILPTPEPENGQTAKSETPGNGTPQPENGKVE